MTVFKRFQLIGFVCAAFFVVTPSSAWASSCPISKPFFEGIVPGSGLVSGLENAVSDHMTDYRKWFAGEFFKENIAPAMQQAAEQLSVVNMQNAFAFGTFLDAKNHLETQRTIQELQVQAHKDYQPSKSFCTFGTNVRSLAHSESASKFNTLALSRRQMNRHLSQKNTSSGAGSDRDARWQQFRRFYCDPQDNGWTGEDKTGLSAFCVADDSDRVNIDIDYTRLVENRRTLDAVYQRYGGMPDELDVMALGNNLYGNRPIPIIDVNENKEQFMRARSISARRSVAENSYNNIVGMKTAGSAANFLNTGDASTAVDTAKYLGAALMELGIPEDEVMRFAGLDPTEYSILDDTGTPDLDEAKVPNFSYYAQLEILSKKIFQSPAFYAALYDKPANVKRKAAALKAIELMLDRAIFESQLRQEMAMSVLLSTRLEQTYAK